jgi:hypothetical protein
VAIETERTLSVDRVAHRVDDTAEQCFSDSDRGGVTLAQNPVTDA